MESKGFVQYYNVYNAVSFDEKTFIEQYSKMYLKGNPCIVPNIRQTDERIEKWILNIAKKDDWDEKDVFNILAWKTGKILSEKKDNKYNTIDDLKYADGCDLDSMTIKAYSAFSVKELAEYIVNHIKELKNDAKKGYGMDAFKKLAENSRCKEIGTVYIITLLFFLSEYRQPIYDTYVARALLALERKEVKPGDRIKGIVEVPNKSEIEKVEDFYKQFKNCIKRFETDYKMERNLDRALWVYGHYFRA